ncbi:MAG TPA: 4-(cytidine 5'-diphospho)-2-C-methyl-D-erythritol kinase [Candidatus Kapabacteria bacterium]|nr:4-(cytidine 5'-diphospho)-2-C-methyl-D-erythritol kinase [Candidatus Kapabacteria bacterium]
MYNKKFKFIKKTANAKINFGLQVLNKRTDGYHNINTIFYPIFLSDTIEFALADDFYFNEEHPTGIPINDNLIYKVWEIMQSNYDISGISVQLNKMIPLGAGLGGGSSDAAKTIIAINELYDLHLSQYDMLQIALKCGSDIPYFFNSLYPATAGSRGEQLEYFTSMKRYHLVLINPGIHVSTPFAYSSLNRNLSDNIEKVDFKDIILNSKKEDFKKLIFNDFEEVFSKDHPEVNRIKQVMYENGSFFALMSGSGSSVFGLFEEKIDKEVFKSTFPDYFIYTE